MYWLRIEIIHLNINLKDNFDFECLLKIDDFEGAKRAGELFGYPLMIKRRRLAYDGRGNAVAKSEDEISWAVNGKNHFKEF